MSVGDWNSTTVSSYVHQRIGQRISIHNLRSSSRANHAQWSQKLWWALSRNVGFRAKDFGPIYRFSSVKERVSKYPWIRKKRTMPFKGKFWRSDRPLRVSNRWASFMKSKRPITWKLWNRRPLRQTSKKCQRVLRVRFRWTILELWASTKGIRCDPFSFVPRPTPEWLRFQVRSHHTRQGGCGVRHILWQASKTRRKRICYPPLRVLLPCWQWIRLCWWSFWPYGFGWRHIRKIVYFWYRNAIRNNWISRWEDTKSSE